MGPSTTPAGGPGPGRGHDRFRWPELITAMVALAAGLFLPLLGISLAVFVVVDLLASRRAARTRH